MAKYYTIEKHTQLLIALMKFHGIRKIIASPGATDICFVGSVQNDPYFEMYSSVDERSAAYMACGLAAESGEPVALVCTGSTASRNYVPALTEAFYRKLPVLAITSTQYLGRVGNNVQQVIDRSQQMKDLVNESVQLTEVHTTEQEKEAELNINRALIALRRNGGGTSHINLVTTYSRDFSVKTLPEVKGISYIDGMASMPSLENYKKIAVLVGRHGKWDEKLTGAVDRFCELHNGVVLFDHSSGYKGKYGVNHALLNDAECDIPKADLVISIGSVAKFSSGMNAEMWLVDPNGEIIDPEGTVTKVFGIDESRFFEHYVDGATAEAGLSYAEEIREVYHKAVSALEHIPFSSTWIAMNTLKSLPEDAVYHHVESEITKPWYWFGLPKTVDCYLNDACLGADGQAAALYGEAVAVPSRLHFAVITPEVLNNLIFITQGKIPENIRVIVLNINSDSVLENSECRCLTVRSKDEFTNNLSKFSGKNNGSVIFEVFVAEEDDQKALNEIADKTRNKDDGKKSGKKWFGFGQKN